MKKLLSAIDRLSHLAGIGVSMLIFPMIGFVVYEVTARYFLDNPSEWVFETALFLFGTMTVLGGCYVLKEGHHAGMDVFYARLSVRKRAMLDLVTSLIFFAFIGVLLYESTIMAWDSWRMNQHSESVWGPPLYPIVTTIPLGALLLLLQGIAKFTRDLHTLLGMRTDESKG